MKLAVDKKQGNLFLPHITLIPNTEIAQTLTIFMHGFAYTEIVNNSNKSFEFSINKAFEICHTDLQNTKLLFLI